MLRFLVRSTLVVAAVVATWSLDGSTPREAYAATPGASCPDHPVAFIGGPDATVCRQWQYGNPCLFYNYYVPPTCGGVGAQLYLAPRPVPALVGHTYYTYQPLMPHEMLYGHNRRYHRHYDNGRGLTRTSILWW